MRRTNAFILSASIATFGLFASPVFADEAPPVSELDKLAYEMVALATARVWSANQCTMGLPDFPATKQDVQAMTDALAQRPGSRWTSDELKTMAEKELKDSIPHLNSSVVSYMGCRSVLKGLKSAMNIRRITYVDKVGEHAKAAFQEVVLR